MTHNFQQVSLSNQSIRITCNDLEKRLVEWQELGARMEAARVQSLTDLQEERLEHGLSREALKFEQERHQETRKTLDDNWETTKRL